MFSSVNGIMRKFSGIAVLSSVLSDVVIYNK
jgi:hypothetical protein